MLDQKNKRNFSIIAHIDHGKSTIADRLLEQTGTVTQREMVDQLLDSMDLEREKGITIKAQAVTLKYKARNGETYELNLIDTPGHVDFIYEVSRSLAACDGALLVVDAAQGIEAQTLANVYLALENDLEILPVINKIDLPSADPDKVKLEIEEVIGLPADDAVLVSGKTGFGIEDLLESIIEHIPAPKGEINNPLKALIFDSHYDDFRGVITYIRIIEGKIAKGDRIKIMSTEKEFDVLEVGIFSPKMKEVDELVEAGADIVALDATLRPRFDGITINEFISQVKKKYPSLLLMADISTFEEGVNAEKAGVDLVGTTMNGYTPYTESGDKNPNFELVHHLSEVLTIPVVAEGRIHEPVQAKKMFEEGAFTVVVGGAITRPLEIATRFVKAIKE
mgnify:CR=1 FL=1